jgi:hypothetical protein
MSTKEILQSIKKLPFKERIMVIEKAVKTLHVTLDEQLEKAATSLLSDYKKDKNLTAFTSLDLEHFYEAK